MDVTSLAALAAGSFASTKAIATLIGETEFSVMFHQGAKENIHISLVDEDVIMVLIFDDRTNLGLVKMVAGQAKSSLRDAIMDVRGNGIPDTMDPPEIPGSPAQGDRPGTHGSQVADRLDDIFPER
jgi:hypothetical protein